MKFHNVSASNLNNKGFTLVEISIVMIIIGLLIGGIFGGIKLLEISQTQRAIQDLKSINSAGVTFKYTYRALPGDIRNPGVRLNDCTTPPCSVGGNGDRIIGIPGTNMNLENLTVTNEKFTIWSHLLAADLITNVKNVNDMEFGEGQPESALDGGYRMNSFGGTVTTGGSPLVYNWTNHTMFLTKVSTLAANTNAETLADHRFLKCPVLRIIDEKIDDGLPRRGNMIVNILCMVTPTDGLSPYGNSNSNSSLQYHLSF